MEPESFDHPWRERRDLNSHDMLLRKHGFSIVGRPKGKEPLWKRNGEIFGETRALEVCYGEGM